MQIRSTSSMTEGINQYRSTVTPENGSRAEEKTDTEEAKKKKSTKELSADQEREVQKLKQRDLQVKRHEQAHQAAGAGITGGASYSYTTGPDGKRYATGGEVSIDVSRERTPEATISKMQRVRAAAMAPADPSGQDYAVARKAQSISQDARKEILQETSEQINETQQQSIQQPKQSTIQPRQSTLQPTQYKPIDISV